MADHRRMIIDWIRVHGGKSYWLLDVYYHLIDKCGATSDEASDALDKFVTEICAIHAARKEPAE